MARENSDKSNRYFVMKELMKLCKEVHNGRYKVHRGAVNWAEFNFDKTPYPLAIVVDDRSFLRQFNAATITLEMMMPFKGNVGDEPFGAVQDEAIEELSQDAELIFVKLLNVRHPATRDSLISKVDQTSDSIQEFSDSNRGIQGIVASVSIEY